MCDAIAIRVGCLATMAAASTLLTILRAFGSANSALLELPPDETCHGDCRRTDRANSELQPACDDARKALDEHAVRIVKLHFDPEGGTPYWLEKAKSYDFDPLTDVKCFDDIKQFPLFEDDDLRGGPVDRMLPKRLHNEPRYVFETGGTTGTPKSRCVVRDHWIDYEEFSKTLPDEHFPLGSNWLMLGPSGPRRLRLAVEHLAQHRGGICFCVDLDPRWVVKMLKKGDIEGAKAYSKHVIDQAVTILRANHDIKCMFATPKLLEALGLRLMEEMDSSIADEGITGIFAGGTEFTPQWYRFCREELLEERVYITPTYGNTLMGLGVRASVCARRQLQNHLLRTSAAGCGRGRRLRRLQQSGRLR